ncbi:hypothetical protein BDV28DRAFT_63071 [Aspergillus coremiiformis]|uniref:Uncharacterized protein n=1 Tax=Aspergillus coremiiformis TaxID=138285 RepID=A0A5N6YV57_9EURO|nr:hypothetical protein BDV28DRAFT_63071 [Aspergillus coremiiformis]
MVTIALLFFAWSRGSGKYDLFVIRRTLDQCIFIILELQPDEVRFLIHPLLQHQRKKETYHFISPSHYRGRNILQSISTTSPSDLSRPPSRISTCEGVLESLNDGTHRRMRLDLCRSVHGHSSLALSLRLPLLGGGCLGLLIDYPDPYTCPPLVNTYDIYIS